MTDWPKNDPEWAALLANEAKVTLGNMASRHPVRRLEEAQPSWKKQCVETHAEINRLSQERGYSKGQYLPFISF